MTNGYGVESIGERLVLVVDDTGTPLGGRDLLDAAADAGADVVACPAGRLDPAFFDLRTGVAGELLQQLVNYGIVLAVVGPLPDVALASRSFTALIREANRGTQQWFVGDMDELRARVGRLDRGSATAG